MAILRHCLSARKAFSTRWRWRYRCFCHRIVASFCFCVAESRLHALGCGFLNDGIAVVALIGEEMGGPRIGERHHRAERRAVRGFAGREVEGEREAAGITETMNFTGEPAPRAAKSLFASPPFAPAAET